VFSTAADSQTSVEIHVLQGERAMAGDNKSLGRFILDGLLPAPRGMPQIEVSFDIDANGIVSVRAQDKGTGREQKIVIQSSSGLSKEEVAGMQREAEVHAQEDARRRQEVEARNAADALAYQAERTLREHGDKVSEELKGEVEGKVAQVRSALQGGDMGQIERAVGELSESLQKVGAAVYQQASPEPGRRAGAGADSAAEGPPPGDAGPKEGTVEGEFREGLH
jgi:molecular chaperone DnaK